MHGIYLVKITNVVVLVYSDTTAVQIGDVRVDKEAGIGRESLIGRKIVHSG